LILRAYREFAVISGDQLEAICVQSYHRAGISEHSADGTDAHTKASDSETAERRHGHIKTRARFSAVGPTHTTNKQVGLEVLGSNICRDNGYPD
jgi:hypothetical protein